MLRDPQFWSAASGWAAVAVMVIQTVRANRNSRRTPPPAVQSGPRVIRKAPKRPRRRVLRPVPVGGAK